MNDRHRSPLEDGFLTVNQVARRLDVEPSLIRNLILTGHIAHTMKPHLRLKGKEVLAVSVEELERLKQLRRDIPLRRGMERS